MKLMSKQSKLSVRIEGEFEAAIHANPVLAKYIIDNESHDAIARCKQISSNSRNF